MTTGAKCPCGCGQADAAKTRLRKASCPGCGYVVRVAREWIGRRLPVCPCGETLEAACLFDRALLPGAEGDELADMGRGLLEERDRRSENARKAIKRRRRCRSCGSLVGKGALYCSRHVHEEMAF